MYSDQSDYYGQYGGQYDNSQGQGQQQQGQGGGQYYYQPTSADGSYDPNQQYYGGPGPGPQPQHRYGHGGGQGQGGQGIPGMDFGQAAGMGNFNPMLTNFAKQYGENLVGQGREMVDEKIQKFVAVSKLKYYFAVDTAYVMKKLGLLFFPFTHKDWSIKFDKNEDDAIQPRSEINAPDLYIPLMAFITYILIAGVSLGLQQKFSPEVLGIQTSSALGWLILELMICTGFTYVIQTDLKVFDLIAFCSYKFIGMIVVLMSCLLLSRTGYYSALIYSCLSLSVFLIRTLKVQVLHVATHDHVVGGNKRRLYFILSVAGIQCLQMWWLTYHLAFW